MKYGLGRKFLEFGIGLCMLGATTGKLENPYVDKDFHQCLAGTTKLKSDYWSGKIGTEEVIDYFSGIIDKYKKIDPFLANCLEQVQFDMVKGKVVLRDIEEKAEKSGMLTAKIKD
jgi:hypothetical protein